MVNLRVSTTENRTTITVDADAKVIDILNDNNISRQGAAVSLNGSPLAESDIQSATLTELGVLDNSTAMLSVIVKADSAAR